jgi:hypothetical protein
MHHTIHKINNSSTIFNVTSIFELVVHIYIILGVITQIQIMT